MCSLLWKCCLPLTISAPICAAPWKTIRLALLGPETEAKGQLTQKRTANLSVDLVFSSSKKVSQCRRLSVMVIKSWSKVKRGCTYRELNCRSLSFGTLRG